MADVDEHRTDVVEHELFARSRLPTIIIDLNQREIVAVNVAGEEFLGLPADQILGRSTVEFMADEVVDETYRRRGLRGDPTRFVRRIIAANGTRICEISMTPTRHEGVVYAQILDITSIVGGDDTAGDQVTNGERVLEAAPIAAVVVDLADRKITRVNAATEEFFGAPRNSLVGRPVSDLIGTDGSIGGFLTAINRGDPGATHELITVAHTAGRTTPIEVTAVGLAETPSAVFLLLPIARQRTPRRARRVRPDPSTAQAEPGVDGALRAQLSAGLALLALGALVLVVGWWLGVDAVTRLAPELASMKANTAVGFLLIGLALVSERTGAPPVVARVSLGLLAVIGALTTIEYWFDLNLGIDELLAAETALTATSAPGRMGLNTAIAFTGIGLGALVSQDRSRTRGVVVGQVAVLASMGLAFLALLGYIFGTTGGRGLASSTEMALHTSIAIIIGGFGLLTTQLDRGVLEPLGTSLAGSRFARRILPVALGSVFASGLFVTTLARLDLLTDPNLELAFLGLLIAASILVLILGTSRRINELDRQAEGARRDLATVMAAFSDRHFRVDADHSARQVTGAGLARSTPTDQLVPPAMRSRLGSALTTARTEGRASEMTYSTDGGQQRLELRVAPLPEDEAAISIRDISELAAARDALAELTGSLEEQVRDRTAELESANVELARSNADLEQFAYLASHDLQEPLRMVSTFVEKLAARLGDDLDDRGRQYVDFAVDGAHRMSELIDGLLQYSRAGRHDPDLAMVDLGALVASTLRTFEQRVEEMGATVHVAPDLPSVWSDEVLLRQVIQNLIGNALKFVDPERPSEVRVDARTIGDRVEIGIADNGVGIAEEFRDQVFLMFRRLHSRSSYPGTGIGLSLVQRLVESLGGTVRIDPDHGPVGTRFVITQPARPPRLDQAPEDPAT